MEKVALEHHESPLVVLPRHLHELVKPGITEELVHPVRHPDPRILFPVRHTKYSPDKV
jgi:hypothetical protein